MHNTASLIQFIWPKLRYITISMTGFNRTDPTVSDNSVESQIHSAKFSQTFHHCSCFETQTQTLTTDSSKWWRLTWKWDSLLSVAHYFIPHFHWIFSEKGSDSATIAERSPADLLLQCHGRWYWWQFIDLIDIHMSYSFFLNLQSWNSRLLMSELRR
jgi:hypothetical protein